MRRVLDVTLCGVLLALAVVVVAGTVAPRVIAVTRGAGGGPVVGPLLLRAPNDYALDALDPGGDATGERLQLHVVGRHSGVYRVEVSARAADPCGADVRASLAVDDEPPRPMVTERRERGDAAATLALVGEARFGPVPRRLTLRLEAPAGCRPPRLTAVDLARASRPVGTPPTAPAP